MTVLKRARKHSPPDLYLSRKSNCNRASNLLLEGIQAGGGVSLNVVKQATTHTHGFPTFVHFESDLHALLFIVAGAFRLLKLLVSRCMHCVGLITVWLVALNACPMTPFPILPHNQTSRPIGFSLNSIPWYHQLSVTPFQQWYAHSAPRPPPLCLQLRAILLVIFLTK